MTRRPSLTLVSFASLVPLSLFAPAGAAQSSIYDLDPPVVPNAFQPELTAPGDVDGDGHADVAVHGLTMGLAMAVVSGRNGTPLATGTTGSELPLLAVDLDGDGLLEFVTTTSIYSAGTITVRDGQDGAVLFTVSPTEGSGAFGMSVFVAGDVDQDGVLDLGLPDPSAAGLWNGQLVGGVGRLRIVSGKDGSRLLERSSPAADAGALDQFFSIAVAPVGDVDSDGRPDLAVGSKGRAWILSGAGLDVIHALGGLDFQGQFGTAIGAAGDVDADGVADVIVGAPQTFAEGPAGYAHVYSGASGLLLRAFHGSPGDFFGMAVDGAGDVDGDGHADVLVGAGQALNGWATAGSGHVTLFSGQSGKALFTVSGDAHGDGFGTRVAGLGDVDLDGAPDFAAARGMNVGGEPSVSPIARVHSSRALMLTSDRHLVDLGQGGTQTFAIDAGPEHAHATAFVLGTASGRAPGITVLGQPLPLNLDAWFLFTAAHPNTAIQGSLQPLDASGRATASLTVPPLSSPALVGLTLDHAVLLLDGNVPTAASHAVPLTLLD